MNNQFSLKQYILIVLLFSWPFQIAYLFLGEAFKFLLLISMVMVAAGTYISGKYIFKDGFVDAGWNWGRPKHYLYVFLLALFLWLLPSISERLLGIYTPPAGINYTMVLSSFLLSSVFTILPAFGEEFGWRGYLLPRLLKRFEYRRALLLHGLITWIWHMPVLISMGIQSGNTPILSVALVLTISVIPTIMHAVVFAYIRNKTQSIAVATIYHVFFDEVRDSLDNTIGLGSLGQNWQMLVLTVLGILLLWKAKWNLNIES